MKPPHVPLEKILALEPACLRLVIPPAYLDENGHMNVRWYLAIFDDAGYSLHARLGLTPEYHQARHTGTMDLEHHINFLREAVAGDRVAVFTRLVDCSPKRIHYVMFMVNETRANLSATFECVNGFVDLTLRKTAAYPAEIAANIRRELAAAAALEWSPPLSGAMHA